MTTEKQKVAIHLQSQVTIQRLLTALKIIRPLIYREIQQGRGLFADYDLTMVDKAIADAEEMPA